MQNQPTTPVKVFFEYASKSDYFFRLYYKAENKPDFLVLEYPLGYGDVSNIPESNAKEVESFTFRPASEYYEDLQTNLNKLACLPTNTPIEIVVTPYPANEIISLYYFANKFSAFDNVCVKCIKFNKKIETIGTTQLTKELINTLSAEWEHLSSSEIRAIKHGKLVSFNLQEAIALVNPIVSTKYATGLKLYGNFIDKYMPEGFMLDMDSLFYVLQLMIDRKMIERTHSTDGQSGDPDMFPEQRFRRIIE